MTQIGHTYSGTLRGSLLETYRNLQIVRAARQRTNRVRRNRRQQNAQLVRMVRTAAVQH